MSEHDPAKNVMHDPPPVGSSDWYGELLQFRVQRQELKDKLESAIGGRSGEELDPHSVSFESASSVEHGALWLLLHELRPGYAAMMYLRHVWLGLDAGDTPERRWFVRQYAAMLLHGGEDVRSSAKYSLWVDFFESGEPEVDFVFRRLLRELPRNAWTALLPDTGPIPWAVKRDVYWQASTEPDLHAALAMGIARSISDLLGRVDVVEAGKLIEVIHIADPLIRSEIEKWIFGPLRLSIVEIAFVESDERPWPDSFLIGFQPVGTPWAVLRTSELFLGDQPFGTVEHLSPPLPHEQRIRRLVAPEASGMEFDPREWTRARVRGPRTTANQLVGKVVEAWPPGLRSKLKPPA